MKRNSLLICLFAVLFLSSCGGRGKTASALANGDTIPLRYAENLTLVSYPGYTLATLRNPWDTLHTLHTYILVPKGIEPFALVYSNSLSDCTFLLYLL